MLLKSQVTFSDYGLIVCKRRVCESLDVTVMRKCETRLVVRVIQTLSPGYGVIQKRFYFLNNCVKYQIRLVHFARLCSDVLTLGG